MVTVEAAAAASAVGAHDAAAVADALDAVAVPLTAGEFCGAVAAS